MAKTKKVTKEKVVKTLEVTQEILDLNPELLAGVEVGDEVEMSDEIKLPEEKAEVKAPKIKGDIAILKGDEYIRTYSAELAETARDFINKDPNRTMIGADSIDSIIVSWRESEKQKDSDTGRMVDTGRMLTNTNVFTEKTHGADFAMKARALANEGVRRSCTAVLKK